MTAAYMAGIWLQASAREGFVKTNTTSFNHIKSMTLIHRCARKKKISIIAKTIDVSTKINSGYDEYNLYPIIYTTSRIGFYRILFYKPQRKDKQSLPTAIIKILPKVLLF